jgi:hypothetical protein
LNKKKNSFRKKNSFCLNSSKLLNKFFEIENALLNVLTLKNVNFRINIINIVQKKTSSKILERFCEHDLNQQEMKKIFIFHITLIIIFNTKTLKFEIKTTSLFKFHINNLSKSFFHWKFMLRNLHAEKILKIA